MANRLASATSPYLLQHAENPVDWWEWGDEAFEQAQLRDVPVLLSVGYAACHWCHVMAHESFEDAATAAMMNEHFVNVKVDREERPDVDAVYMQAVQGLTGQGGWPMTVFLTPQGLPFYGGTYFPPAPRHGLASFPQVLTAVAAAWRERADEARGASQRIAAQLGELSALPSGDAAPAAEDLDTARGLLRRDFDRRNAGFGQAPKFPPSMVLEFLLRHHARTGDDDALSMVAMTCERMARGGMYDLLCGGFARYSVDEAWVVPHFEKMLYDNALLLRVYLHWWRSTGSALARRVVHETAQFLLRDLRTAEGGFASALDADTPLRRPDGTLHGVEGATYVWSRRELLELLGERDGEWAASLLTVGASGSFEGELSTLQLPADPDDAERWARLRAQLQSARRQRPQPGRDDKIVAAWNGLAIAALAEAGLLMAQPAWVEAAQECAHLLLRVHRRPGGRLFRTSREGAAGTSAAVLEDYADVAEGLLALLSVTGESSWLDAAGELLEVVLEHFADAESGGFFDTADDELDPRLAGIRRPQDPTDNATPSGWSAAAAALLTYAAVTGSQRHRRAAERALILVTPLARRAPRFAGWGLAAAEALLAGPAEVAVVGRHDDPRRHELHLAALSSPVPGLAVVVGEPADAQAPVALLANRGLVDGQPAAYVCRGFVCRLPVTSPQALREELTALLRR